ncbi:MAG: hypothetical protein COA78_08050 [Blastopirellula sp.]|nr:MAG: hypothetical protein COA78_08050 [Blastopirellula sp.]
MSNETSNSLVSLGNLTKPANTLIEKSSAAVGGLFLPYQIKRVAKAEAEAALIKAKSEIQITDLHRRAMHRFVEEEAKKQENMEQITGQALPLLEESSTPEDVEDDWLTNFFDKCRIISDEDMQLLWSKVLASEANSPGAFSKRTVNSLSSLDKNDALSFTQLCNFGWQIDDSLSPLVYDKDDDIYERCSISYGKLSHLESIGLIRQIDFIGSFTLNCDSSVISASYDDHSIQLHLEDGKINIGKVMLSQTGKELAMVCDVESVEGFKEYVCNKWRELGYIH